MDESAPGGRVRIWSAGCSSGQEPYSIALSILSLMPDARSFDVRILATDINPHVLQTARRGVYSAEEASERAARAAPRLDGARRAAARSASTRRRAASSPSGR